MNKPLIIFGICCTILAAAISFYLLFTEPKFILEAHGQTQTCPYGYYLASNGLCYQDQTQTSPTINSIVRTENQTMMHELTYYDDLLAAFINACDNEVHKIPSNQADPATLQKCYEIIQFEHDILTPFINIEKDNMSKIIVGH